MAQGEKKLGRVGVRSQYSEQIYNKFLFFNRLIKFAEYIFINDINDKGYCKHRHEAS